MEPVKTIKPMQAAQLAPENIKPGMVILHGLVLAVEPFPGGYRFCMPGRVTVIGHSGSMVTVLCRVTDQMLRDTREADEAQEKDVRLS